MLKKTKITMIIFIIVLLFDLLIMVLGKNNYFFNFLHPTGILFPTLLTVFSLYLLAWAYKIKIYWVIAGTVVALIFLGNLLLDNFLLDNSYDYVKSPNGKVTLVIEYRNATLGETQHFYNFYRITEFPMIIKKLNKDTVTIITRGTTADDLTVLGANNRKWLDGNKVVFSSPFTENDVEVKY